MGLRQNALILASLTALIAVVGDWSGEPSLQRIWYLPAGLFFFGLAYERWWTQRCKLRLSLHAQGRALLGKEVRLNCEFKHDATRSVLVEFAPASPAGITLDTSVLTCRVSVGDGGTQISMTPRKLGLHQWPALRTRLAGPLGLAWWAQTINPKFSLQVIPDMLSAEDHRLAASSVGRVALRTVGSGSEVLQLRDYYPGDSLHLIDWKATARASRLIARDFTQDQHLEVILAVDAGRASQQRCGSLDRFGHYVNVAARFAEHAVAHDDRVGLVIFAEQPLAVLAPLRGHAAVMRIRSLLGNAQPVRAESNPLAAAIKIAALVRQRSLVVMLTDLDDATTASQLAGAVRLLLPKHLPLIAGLQSPDIRTLAEREARTWLDPYQSLAAKEYELRLQRNVQALRSFGAPALATQPDLLEKTVLTTYEGFRARRRV